MNVISIDQSKTSTGVYCRVDHHDFFYRIRTKQGMKHGKALQSIENQLSLILEMAQYDFAIMEGYAYGSPTVTISAEVGGVIKLVLSKFGINDVIQIAPGSWKKHTIGTVKKSPIKPYLQAVCIKYCLHFNNTDEADAYMLYQAMKEVGITHRPLTKADIRIKDFLERMIEKCTKDE
ncbi:hypothetical protein KAR91_33000 [Candidatus Pacearchaeota archaeon]|nr:hypothetical protein [Candidatus Pacearchaeota archaeon]